MTSGIFIGPMGAGRQLPTPDQPKAPGKTIASGTVGAPAQMKSNAKIMTGAIAMGMDKAKSIKKMAGKGLGMAGISMSISSLLRMSQVFTGTIGALFQVLGGFIDAILAPFMPYFGKMIGKLGEQIPKVQAFAQKIHDVLAWVIPKFWAFITGKALPVIPVLMAIGAWAIGSIKNLWKLIQNWWGENKGTFKGWLETIWGYILSAWGTLKDVWGWITEVAKPWLIDKWERFKKKVKELWTNIKKPITDAWDAVVVWWNTTGSVIFDDIWNQIQLVIDPIKDIVLAVVDVMKPLLKLGFKFFMWYAEKLWGFYKKIFGWLWDNLIKPILSNFGDFLKPKLEWLAEKLNALVEWFNSPGNIFEKLKVEVMRLGVKILNAFAEIPMIGSGAASMAVDLQRRINSMEFQMSGGTNTQMRDSWNPSVSVTNNITGGGGGGVTTVQESYSQSRNNLTSITNGIDFQSNTSALNAIIEAKG